MNSLKHKVGLALALTLLAGEIRAENCYIGEIKLFAGNFAPAGWAFANGSTLSIGDYMDLFTVLGTTYGGDGMTTFALPDLRGRVPVHQGTLSGNTVSLGETLGAATVTLAVGNLPSGATMGHQASVSNQTVNNALLAAAGRSAKTVDTQTRVGGTAEPITLAPPSLGLNYIVCLSGSYPSP